MIVSKLTFSSTNFATTSFACTSITIKAFIVIVAFLLSFYLTSTTVSINYLFRFSKYSYIPRVPFVLIASSTSAVQ